MSADHLSAEIAGAIIDGGLSPADEAAAQTHLDQCHACALRVVRELRLKAAVRQSGTRFTPSAETLSRLQAQVSNRPQAPGRTRGWRWDAWGAIAAAVVFALWILATKEYRQSRDLTAEVLDQHLAVLSDTSSPQVLSSDRHTVKPWFQGKLPFSFNLPEPSALPPDTTLAGADLTYIEGRPAAMLLFTLHKHRVSVFVTEKEGFGLPMLREARAGFEIARASSAGLEFVGVSDVNRPELEALMRALVSVQ